MARSLRFGGAEAACGRIERSRIVIVPVPYDGTSTWLKGADKGPFAVLEASPALEFYSPETDSEVYRKGIYTAEPLKVAKLPPEKMVSAVEREVSRFLGLGKFTVLLGGEHSVSVGAVSAHLKKFGKMSVLFLDAHADLRDEYRGSMFNHACTAARLREACPVVHVGTRSLDVSEKRYLGKGKVFFARDIAGKFGWAEKVASAVLSEKVYVSIDLDVFDPSIIPSTGTPEPGGLSWYEVTDLLGKVAEKKNVVGFDVVELCPNKFNKAPDFLAAKLVYQFLSYIFKDRR